MPRQNNHYIDRQGGRRSVERFFVARDSSWREILRGESLRGERFFTERVFMEIEASWRDSRHGEKLFMERKSSWREVLRGERLQGEGLRGETLSVEKLLQGEMIFKEIMSLWRYSSRRDSLRGDLAAHANRRSYLSSYSLGWFTYAFVQSS
ncbi:hypothetical protein AOQ84DRAFT_380314 [Glonium stellatum]|uniref:Uncharacterized protein n=1 Tax=Glonium stellatum TaxID=574774 RepID=A0A8E2ETR6_9PEZI|nr:hypothetical protein AOQ84DRAFT_380314 [Glonium stellatum]